MTTGELTLSGARSHTPPPWRPSRRTAAAVTATCLVATASYAGSIAMPTLFACVYPAVLTSCLIATLRVRARRSSRWSAFALGGLWALGAAEIVNVTTGTTHGPVARSTFLAAIGGLFAVALLLYAPRAFWLPVAGMIVGALVLGSAGEVTAVVLVTLLFGSIAALCVESDLRRSSGKRRRQGSPAVVTLLAVGVAALVMLLQHADQKKGPSVIDSGDVVSDIRAPSLFALGQPAEQNPGQATATTTTTPTSTTAATAVTTLPGILLPFGPVDPLLPGQGLGARVPSRRHPTGAGRGPQVQPLPQQPQPPGAVVIPPPGQAPVQIPPVGQPQQTTPPADPQVSPQPTVTAKHRRHRPQVVPPTKRQVVPPTKHRQVVPPTKRQVVPPAKNRQVVTPPKKQTLSVVAVVLLVLWILLLLLLLAILGRRLWAWWRWRRLKLRLSDGGERASTVGAWQWTDQRLRVLRRRLPSYVSPDNIDRLADLDQWPDEARAAIIGLGDHVVPAAFASPSYAVQTGSAATAWSLAEAIDHEILRTISLRTRILSYFRTPATSKTLVAAPVVH